MYDADVRLFAALDTDNFKMQSELFRGAEQSNFEEGSQAQNLLLLRDT